MVFTQDFPLLSSGFDWRKFKNYVILRHWGCSSARCVDIIRKERGREKRRANSGGLGAEGVVRQPQGVALKVGPERSQVASEVGRVRAVWKRQCSQSPRIQRMEAASVSGEVAGNVGVELETELHETDRCPSPTGVSSSQKACRKFHAIGRMEVLTHVHSVLSRWDNLGEFKEKKRSVLTIT